MARLDGLRRDIGLQSVQINSFSLDVARGNINGISTTHRYGHNSGIASSEESIWTAGGVRPLPSSSSLFNVVSASANDSISGTGLRQLLLEGLDENFLEQSEVLSLNGTTPVSTVNKYIRINRLIGLNAGSGLTNSGVITAQIGSTVYEHMDAGRARSESAAYTVPLNMNAYIINLLNSSTLDQAIRINAYFIGQDHFRLAVHTEYLSNSATHPILPTNPKVPGGVTFEIRAENTTAGNPSRVSSSFDLYLVEEN